MKKIIFSFIVLILSCDDPDFSNPNACDSNGILGLDCKGVCGGSATEDCAGICNGSSIEDCAGICNGSSIEDCTGVCNGSAELDDCGVCNGLNENKDCSGVCNGFSIEDCAGVCNGSAIEDCVGICNGSSIEDCAGVCNGFSIEDCAGVCGGNAELGCSGLCDTNPTCGYFYEDFEYMNDWSSTCSDLSDYVPGPINDQNGWMSYDSFYCPSSGRCAYHPGSNDGSSTHSLTKSVSNVYGATMTFSARWFGTGINLSCYINNSLVWQSTGGDDWGGISESVSIPINIPGTFTLKFTTNNSGNVWIDNLSIQ